MRCFSGKAKSRVVLSVEPNQVERVLSLASDAGVPAARIGTVGGNRFVMQVEDDKSGVGCPLIWN